MTRKRRKDLRRKKRKSVGRKKRKLLQQLPQQKRTKKEKVLLPKANSLRLKQWTLRSPTQTTLTARSSFLTSYTLTRQSISRLSRLRTWFDIRSSSRTRRSLT